MVIDIIDYQDTQYIQLGEYRLERVRLAQLEKNKLLSQLAKDKRRAKYKLLKNGTYRSGIYASVCAELERQCEEEIKALRDGLLFYLRYSMRPDASPVPDVDAPYEVDYSFSDEMRLSVVKGYYESTYTDPGERFNAFAADEVAPQYLGELYKALYDFFKVQI
jgi:hypothetical protein